MSQDRYGDLMAGARRLCSCVRSKVPSPGRHSTTWGCHFAQEGKCMEAGGNCPLQGKDSEDRMARRIALMLVALVAALVLASGVAIAALVTCPAGGGICEGTPNDDDIDGSLQDDQIFAKAGNDLVLAAAGNDTVHGDEGDDGIDGQEGDDALHGDLGVDELASATGKDFFSGGRGNDTISANDSGGTGGSDTVNGGRGDDTIFVADGEKDTVDCGKGRRDFVSFDRGVDVLTNCERKQGF
jgi:hemolysin type calcium-binding protein